MEVLFVGIAAFVGGIANALLGWAKQNPPEKWDSRKFVVSVVTALIGAAIIAEGFNYSGITNSALAYVGAFIAGVGVQGGTVNVFGAIAMRAKNPK